MCYLSGAGGICEEERQACSGIQGLISQNQYNTLHVGAVKLESDGRAREGEAAEGGHEESEGQGEIDKVNLNIIKFL